MRVAHTHPMRPRVVIVGGGVGGTMVANRLAGRAEVTVVNNFPDHLNQPSFLYLALGQRLRTAAPERRLLRSGVKFRVAKAAGIEFDARLIRTDEGESIPYDWLVLATGSRLKERETPGFMEGAHHFHCRWAADRLWRRLQDLRGGRIVVGAWALPYKCPPAPHEFILLLDEFLRRRRIRDRAKLTFVYPTPALFSKPAVVRVLEPLFQERGIEAITGFVPSHVEPGNRHLHGRDGRGIDYDLLVMVPPHQGSPLARATGLADSDGWIPANPHTLKARDRVYVLGDAAKLTVPKSGAAAHFQAGIVAGNVLSEIDGKEPIASYDGGVT